MKLITYTVWRGDEREREEKENVTLPLEQITDTFMVHPVIIAHGEQKRKKKNLKMKRLRHLVSKCIIPGGSNTKP